MFLGLIIVHHFIVIFGVRYNDPVYSLLLLFIPFRDEGMLLQENETAEEAFNRLLPLNSTCSVYHAKLQKVLEAQSHINK